ncbi:MAG TPA: DUF423 domain-containing protein [Terricaulis sp.]|nr:DUF423 domain-containing protein [Terricaulis sp.]HRP11573.1 DUF423 domain-containing protein [Terricaulis sp.]
MRFLNVFAALSGACGLIMLVLVAHALALEPMDGERVRTAAYLQLFAAAAGLALANRAGRLNLIAGAAILAGAALFALALYTLAIAHTPVLIVLAPVGGVAMIGGWFLLVFAKPGA